MTPPPGARRVPSVAANGMVWAVATAGGEGATVAEQTAATLRVLDATLEAACSSKVRNTPSWPRSWANFNLF
jgi:CO/xanthine dehydrogenase FAD-binding subunit